MPQISLNQFRTIAPTLGLGERVKVGTVDDGTKGLKATDNFGTKATRWFDKAFKVEDKATQAFKAAVRRELGGDEQAAQRVFQAGGVRAKRPLTADRLANALNRLTVEKQAAGGGGAALGAFREGVRNGGEDRSRGTTLSDSGSGSSSTSTGGLSRSADGGRVLPPTGGAANGGQASGTTGMQPPPVAALANPDLPAGAGKAWTDFVAANGNGLRCYSALSDLTKAAGPTLAGPARDALADHVRAGVAGLVDFLEKIEAEVVTSPAKYGGLLEAAKEALAGGADPARAAKVDKWLAGVLANAPPPRPTGDKAPLGERLWDVRDKMAALAKDLGAPGANRAKVLDEYKALGGKLIAAMLESPVSDGAFSSGSTTTGFVRYTSARDGDVAALLAHPELVKPHKGLMPPFAPDVAPMFQEALKAFAADYGPVAAIHAHAVLAKADVGEEHLRPLHDAAARASETRSGVAKFALHGATQMARVVDSTPALARAIALRQGDQDLGFEEAGVGGARLTPPKLRPDVDAAKVGKAAALGDILGAGFRAKDGSDPPAAEVNGRTLRFAADDGRVIAFKFMKADEDPGKLQREHESFGLMAAALGDDYPARPRLLGAGGDQALIRVPKGVLPPDALKALEDEVGRKGLPLKEEGGSYLVMSYEVRPARTGGAPAEAFFEYLEETPDDKAFVSGFESSMRTLGQMADKGYFNPNLIKNAYHDPPAAKPGEKQSEGRAWIWSPNLLLPSRDNTGKEDQQLANAKWTNFRVGGLADPDEFRHISDLKATEFGKILNDSVIAGEMSGKPAELGRLLPAFMIGRMIHESVVVATRRLVDQGAFDPGTPPQRKQELVEAFKAGVKQGVEAFAAEFTGREPGEVAKALKANGLDLDATLDGLVREREALHSYAYTDAFRENDAQYFADVFGVDKSVIEFRAPDSESWRKPGEHVPLKDVMAGPDPVGWLMQNQVMGFTTVVAVDPNGKAVAAGDLGWVANNLRDHGGIFADDTAGVGKVDISDTETQGRVVTIQVDPGFKFDDYLGGLRSRAHELQNAGGFNGAYFHQNEQHLNHILSSTLVDLRTAD